MKIYQVNRPDLFEDGDLEDFGNSEILQVYMKDEVDKGNEQLRKMQSKRDICEALSKPSDIADDFIPTGCAPKIVQVEEMEENYKLFKTMIKGHENKIRNFFSDRIRKHFKKRVPGIADDFMQELNDIPVSKEDTLVMVYEMRFSIKELLQVIKEMKL